MCIRDRYEQFNLKKPVDFHSPSLSVSDIVAIKQNGKVSLSLIHIYEAAVDFLDGGFRYSGGLCEPAPRCGL